MAKQIWKALDDLSPSQYKLRNLPRKPDGLYNLKVNEYGQLVKRAGYAVYNTVIGGGSAHKILGMHRYYQQDLTKEFIVAWNRGWYKIADATGHAVTTLLSKAATDFTTTADQDTYWIDFLNHCYGVNSKGLWKYGGTYVRTVGITVPDKPTFASFQTDGALGTGIYYFKVTYVDEDGYESNGSDASASMTTTGADDAITITIPKSDDAKVPAVGGKRNIYRTSVGGAIFYYDGVVDNNSATSYKSDGADSALGTELHTNHTAPPSTPHLIAKRRNKLYLAYNDYLYPSHTSNVEYFPATWRLRTGNSRKIMGLLEQLTALPVTTVDSIERLVGTDEDNFEFKNSYSTEGNVAMRSYVNCDNLIVYLGYNGINYFDGVSSGIFSEALNKYIRDNIVDAYRHLSCATYFDDKYILCYPKTGGVYPTETVWYDLKNKTYGVYSFAFSCFSLWDKGTDGLKLKGGSNTIGQVYSVFSGLTDNTAAITAYDDIEPLDMGKPDVYKQWYSVFIKVKTLDGIETTPTLAIGSIATKVSNIAFTFSVAGTQYSKAAVAAGTAPGNDVIPEDKYGAVAFDIGINGTIDVIEATGNAAGTYTTAALAIAGLAAPLTGHVRMGTITAMKSDGAFTFGTTSLAATNTTVAYTSNIGTAMTMYYTLDDNTETSASRTLTANTTKWYRISLGSGGKRARSFKPRPYISNKYAFEIHGLMICYEEEKFAEEKE